MKIEQLKENNIQIASELVLSILHAEFINIFSNKGMNTLIDFYSIEKIKDRIKEEDTIFYQFINKEGFFMGVAEMENNHIVTLFIDNSYRNQKIATIFFYYLIENKLVKDTISVYATPITINFYKKHGFEPKSVNLKEEHGIVFMPMIKNLNHIPSPSSP